jgi:hypothetical protein
MLLYNQPRMPKYRLFIQVIHSTSYRATEGNSIHGTLNYKEMKGGVYIFCCVAHLNVLDATADKKHAVANAVTKHITTYLCSMCSVKHYVAYEENISHKELCIFNKLDRLSYENPKRRVVNTLSSYSEVPGFKSWPRLSVTLTEFFHSFPQFLHANAGRVP